MNIAGVGALGRFWDVPVADYSRIVDVNLKGSSTAARSRCAASWRRGGARSSTWARSRARCPLAYHATYAATKAGVLGLGRALNEELRHAGHGRTIKVATVMPWAVDTPFFQHVANYSGHADRMILLDGPEKVARALVWVSLHPREELPVGWKAQMGTSAHRFFPDLTERIAADIHRAEIAKGTPVPATSGAVHAPMAEGPRRRRRGPRAHEGRGRGPPRAGEVTISFGRENGPAAQGAAGAASRALTSRAPHRRSCLLPADHPRRPSSTRIVRVSRPWSAAAFSAWRRKLE
jgi:hypothetical protein